MNQGCLFNDTINIPGLTYISSYISSAYEEKWRWYICGKARSSDNK